MLAHLQIDRAHLVLTILGVRGLIPVLVAEAPTTARSESLAQAAVVPATAPRAHIVAVLGMALQVFVLGRGHWSVSISV